MAPELAALAIVKNALQTALLALVAEHPTLQDFAASDPPSLRLARRLVTAAKNLDHALHRYRSAVYDAIQPRPVLPEDLPF